ncbi:MAG: hypothetical protein ORN49_07075 [Rhodobacteraceae bacterium]|nr:hypothetical protein [Paracoccaceae bacterium]
MLDPKLLILDEPTEGLAPAIVSDVVGLVRRLSAEGMGILLVEQNFRAAIAASRRVAIMVNGVIVATLPATDLDQDTDMQRRHLGIATDPQVAEGDAA